MSHLNFRIVNVFTFDGGQLTGNPLCVFEDAQGLDSAAMQALARQFNLSETTFILPSTSANAHVRIFTPSYEMPFAGHPTLGTAYVCRELGLGGDQIRLQMQAGSIPVEADGNRWTLQANAPTWRECEASRGTLAAMLGLDVSESYFEHREPYFFDYVENELIEKYGARLVRQGGLQVHTTVDLGLQEVGLEAMRRTLPYSTDPAAALVSIDPRNGRVRAMVSSASYESTQFNLAAQGRRQPGSTFKTFVLTTAIKQGIDPYSTYYTSKPLDLDLPYWGHWEVATADEGYQGTVNLQQATVSSDNTVFAQLDLDVGPKSVAQTAKSMGITTQLDGIPAEGIGGLRIGVSPLEMADAYATLAAGGIHRRPVSIERVVFPNGHVDKPQPPRPERAVSPAVAWEVTRLLHDNITEGTGTGAYTGCAGQAGKTGTTDEYTDAWFTGYQPNLATAVWVGYPESNEISMSSVHGTTVFGGTFTADIWHSLYAEGGVPCEEFSEPEEKIQWAPYYGRFARAAPTKDELNGGSGDGGEEPPPGSEAVGGYDPDAYAPGAGQEPAPIPDPYVPPQNGVDGGESAGTNG